MEATRTKNISAHFAIPMIDTANPETFLTGKTIVDTAYYKDGAGAWTALAITDTFAEIASTGVYEITLTAAEMNHDQILIKCTEGTVQDNMILINTIPEPANVEEIDNDADNATSLGLAIDTDDDVVASNLKQINDASVVGNAATLTLKQLDVQNSAGTAIIAKSTGGGGHGIDIAGNGAGNGTKTIGGATGAGIDIAGGGTSGDGISIATTTGDGIDIRPGTGDGINIFPTSGHGMDISAQGSDRHGIQITGGDNGHGITATAQGTGHGIKVLGGATSGDGINTLGRGTGNGITAESGTGATGNGIQSEAKSTNGFGFNAQGIGTGHGIQSIGGATGSGMKMTGGATSGHGLEIIAGPVGDGIQAQGGVTSGDGIDASAQTSGAGLTLSGAGAGKDISATEIDDIKTDTAAILVDTADMQPKLGTPAGADMSADIAAVKVDTAAILVDTADIQPKIGTITDLGAGATIGDNLADMAGAGFITGDDSLEAIRNRGDAAWTTGAAGSGLTPLATGTAQAGAATTITLAAGENANDNFYKGTRVLTTGGTGSGQSRIATGYNGTTKVLTVSPAWVTNPDATTTYEIQASDSNLGAIGQEGIDGNNADLKLNTLDIQSTTGDAVTMLSGGGNGAGLKITADGSGHGIESIAGATGSGIKLTGGATSGHGLEIIAGAVGDGIQSQGGSTSGDGICATAQTLGVGLNALGAGANAGIKASGGATGSGINAIGGATSGHGFELTATDGSGISTTGAGANASGLLALGAGSGSGVQITGGATGNGLSATGGGAGQKGARFKGGAGAGNGHGMTIDGGAGGDGHGLVLTSVGTGNAADVSAGGTGKGMNIAGGATSGHGVTISTTDGCGVSISAAGASEQGIDIVAADGDGIKSTGGTNGHGILSTGAGTGHGMSLVKGGTGKDIDADQIDDILVDTAEIGVAGAGLTDLGGMSTGMKAEVNSEVDGALDTAIPGSPTADSINERIKAIDELTEASGSGDLAAIKTATDTLDYENREWFVDSTNGDDVTGDGKRGTPYKTIKKAHDDGNDGDDIRVINYAATLSPGESFDFTKKMRMFWDTTDDGKNGFDSATDPHWIKITGHLEMFGLVNLEAHASKPEIIIATEGAGKGAIFNGCTLFRIDMATPSDPGAAVVKFSEGCRITNFDYGTASILGRFIVQNSVIQNSKGLTSFTASNYLQVDSGQCSFSADTGDLPILAGFISTKDARISSGMDLADGTAFAGCNGGVIADTAIEGDFLGGAYGPPALGPHKSKLLLISSTVQGNVDTVGSRVVHISDNTNVEGTVNIHSPSTIDGCMAEGAVTLNIGEASTACTVSHLKTRGTLTIASGAVNTFIDKTVHNGLTDNESATSKVGPHVYDWDDLPPGEDWSTVEKEQMRHRWDIDGDQTAPTSGGAGKMTDILTDTADMQPKLGTPAGADMSADIAAVKVDTAATLVDTAEIGTAGAGLTDLGGMSTGMKAEVNAEVDTALDEGISELPQALPPVTPSLRQASMLHYMRIRNSETETAAELKIRNDAGTVIAKRPLAEDGTTFTGSKMVTGP